MVLPFAIGIAMHDYSAIDLSARPPIKKHHKQVRKAPTKVKKKKRHVTVKPVLLRLIYRKTGIIETYLP
jgi:hypothetical protein